jgi:hypothetical protein
LFFQHQIFLDICGSLRQLFSFTGVYYVLSYCLAIIASVEVAYSSRDKNYEASFFKSRHFCLKCLNKIFERRQRHLTHFKFGPSFCKIFIEKIYLYYSSFFCYFPFPLAGATTFTITTLGITTLSIPIKNVTLSIDGIHHEDTQCLGL